ncbi:MAG: SET domain-containing protein [Bacteroidota bacterium]|nr:SET domain-containing protein [Bacteroidota bacterium]
MIFELRASPIHGVGVFAMAKIKKGVMLPLFEEDDYRFIHPDQIKNMGIPKRFIRKYSIEYKDGYSSPKNFNRMSIGWYLNHSAKPNVFHDDNYDFFAMNDIKKDEEITVDYDEL